MGSSCFVNGCKSRKFKKGKDSTVQFHQLSAIFKKHKISQDFFSEFTNTRRITANSRICSPHLKELEKFVNNKENGGESPTSFSNEDSWNLAPSPQRNEDNKFLRSYTFGNENFIPTSLLMNIVESLDNNVPNPLLVGLDNRNSVLTTGNDVSRSSFYKDNVLEALKWNYVTDKGSIQEILNRINGKGDKQSSMIADASRENCNDEINMAAASTSDAKITTDGPSQKEIEDESKNESSSHGIEAPKAVKEEVGLDTTKPVEPSSNPPSTPPTNGEIHRDTVEGVVLAKEEANDGHVSSGDESPKLVINEICDRKEAAARNHTKNEAVSILPTETIPSIPQERSSANSSPKSPLKRAAIDDLPEAVENVPKRPRLREDLDPMSHYNLTQMDATLSQMRLEIENLGSEIARKEEEWNSLIRVQKRKEEAFVVLERRRAVLAIKQEEGRSNTLDEREENLASIASQNIYNSQLPLIMMKHMLGENFMNHLPPASNRPPSRHRDGSSSNGPKAPSPNNISIIDIHTNNCRSNSASDAPQVSISPEAHTKLGRHLNSIMSMKPILPKPPTPTNNVGPISNHVGNPPHSYPSGMGPQGPTVSINHIIAAHRRENPNVPPISETSVLSRGAKRGAWRHKYEGEKRGSPREPDRPSSVSSSNNETDLRLNSSLNAKAHLSNLNNSSLLAMNDPSVSYKDVLLQFAQLTQQTEKSPGSPQISIIPVSSSDTPSRKFEHTPDSTSVSRELSIPSQASNQSPSLEGSSALAKLLLESGAGNHHGSGSKNSAVDLSSYGASPDSLTLSALLSGGTVTTHKDKPSSGSQMESRPPKKNLPTDESGSNPKCQGCHKMRAQFVCAGCSNQWYCSRSCQVTAWEHHSQHCNS